MVADPSELSDADLTIDLCGPADRGEQARLFDACFNKAATAQDLAWRYDRGPHGAAVSLLARPPGGEGVSGYACSPRLALSFGREDTLAPVGETGDVMTHPDWRKRGIFSALDRRCMQEVSRLGWPVVFGLPNRRSAHIFVELGWEVVGAVRPYSFYLSADGGARAEAHGHGRLRALTLGWRAARCRRRRAALDRAGFEVRALERFPAQTLELSRAVEQRFAFMVRRDPDYMNWRFIDNPAGLHEVQGVYRDDRLEGLCVTQRPRPGESVGYLTDLLTAGDEQTVGVCLKAGLDRLEQRGASVVQATALDGSWWREVLVGAGFLAPREEAGLRVILHPQRVDHPLVAAARDTASWYFTDADRDDATMG